MTYLEKMFAKNFQIKIFYAKITSSSGGSRSRKALRVEAEAIQKLRLPHPCLEPLFFEEPELVDTGYGISIHFKCINLQYFAILSPVSNLNSLLLFLTICIVVNWNGTIILLLLLGQSIC